MKHKTLYHNGEIYTCNLRDEVTRAMVVQESRILYVGTYREACRLLDDDTEMVDLQGKAIIPGFFDSLLHLQGSDEPYDTAPPLLISDDELTQKANDFSKECAMRGITSVCCPTDFGAETVRTVTRSALKGNLSVRATLLVGDPHNPIATEALHHRLLDCGICTGLGDGFVRIGAAVVCPRDKSTMENNISRLIEAGMQLHFHTESERELADVLSAYEWARQREGAIKRAKVTVNFPIFEKTAERIISLGLVVVTSPLLWWENDIEENTIVPVRYFTDRLATVTVASEARHSKHLYPMAAVQALVTAQPPEGALSLPQALRACTYGGAYASFAEDRVGSLEWGKYADYCLLSSSLSDISPLEIQGVTVEKTFIGGKAVYQSAAHKGEKDTLYRFPSAFAK